MATGVCDRTSVMLVFIGSFDYTAMLLPESHFISLGFLEGVGNILSVSSLSHPLSG